MTTRKARLLFLQVFLLMMPGCGTRVSNDDGGSDVTTSVVDAASEAGKTKTVAQAQGSKKGGQPESIAFDYSAILEKSKTGCVLSEEDIEEALELPPGSVKSETRGKYCEYRWPGSTRLPARVSIFVYGESYAFDKATKTFREGAEMGIRFSENLAEHDDHYITVDSAGKILIFVRKGNLSLDINFRGGTGTKMNFKQASDQDIADRKEEAIKIAQFLMRKYRS